MVDRSIATVQEVVDVTNGDFDFVGRLRHVVETSPMDFQILGAFIQESLNLQTTRRLHVWLFISLVESVVATLKRDALEYGHRLTSEERLLLTDTTCDVSEQGEPVSRPLFLQIQKNVRFAFRSYAKSHNVKFKPDYGGQGWKAFQETVKIRNRITHPKRIEDMSISDAEMEAIDTAHDWFIETYRALRKAEIDKLERELAKHDAGA